MTNQISYRDLYGVFNKSLVSAYEIDWYDVYEKYLSIGNYAGIYPDTALLLMMLTDILPVNNVMEIGSGASTLFLKKACDRCEINFTSYEEKDKYLGITKELIKLYDIDASFLKLCPEKIDFTGVDMLFLDGIEENRVKLLDSDDLINIPVIILDDFGSINLSKAVSKFTKRCPGDRPFYVYNGVGRQDRHQLISWDSDKIGPVGEIIAQHMPRIGVS